MTSLTYTAILSGALAFSAAQASANPYDHRGYEYRGSSLHENCDRLQRDQQGTGALIGGVLGGLAGFGLAGNPSVEDEGAILGAVVGAVAGSQVAKRSSNCNSRVYSAPQTATYGQNHTYGQPSHTGYKTTTYPDDPLYGGRNDDYANVGHHPHQGQKRVYSHSTTRGYGHHAPAAKECEQVMQVTRLPDGREIHEPVTACREAHYGDWAVKDDHTYGY